ncbi:hypothetical protein HK096_007071 [Nowakowskiella sp. JEL0078]|nr:hypothetical protein HK096_007071 [Nowakowskiella sp. JEL0078]
MNFYQQQLVPGVTPQVAPVIPTPQSYTQQQQMYSQQYAQQQNYQQQYAQQQYAQQQQQYAQQQQQYAQHQAAQAYGQQAVQAAYAAQGFTPQPTPPQHATQQAQQAAQAQATYYQQYMQAYQSQQIPPLPAQQPPAPDPTTNPHILTLIQQQQLQQQQIQQQQLQQQQLQHHQLQQQQMQQQFQLQQNMIPQYQFQPYPRAFPQPPVMQVPPSSYRVVHPPQSPRRRYDDRGPPPSRARMDRYVPRRDTPPEHRDRDRRRDVRDSRDKWDRERGGRGGGYERRDYGKRGYVGADRFDKVGWRRRVDERKSNPSTTDHNGKEIYLKESFLVDPWIELETEAQGIKLENGRKTDTEGNEMTHSEVQENLHVDKNIDAQENALTESNIYAQENALTEINIHAQENALIENHINAQENVQVELYIDAQEIVHNEALAQEKASDGDDVQGVGSEDIEDGHEEEGEYIEIYPKVKETEEGSENGFEVQEGDSNGQEEPWMGFRIEGNSN